MQSRSKFLASAAASLFLAGGAGIAGAAHHERGHEKGREKDASAKVECQGVNSCKGHSACATEHNACTGLNSCKGKGFLKLTAEECEKAKAEQKKS